MVATHISAPDYPTKWSDSLKEAEKASLYTTYEQTMGLKLLFFKILAKNMFLTNFQGFLHSQDQLNFLSKH